MSAGYDKGIPLHIEVNLHLDARTAGSWSTRSYLRIFCITVII